MTSSGKRLSIHLVVESKHLEFRAAVYLIGRILILGREREDILLIEHLPLRKLRVLPVDLLRDSLRARFAITLRL